MEVYPLILGVSIDFPSFCSDLRNERNSRQMLPALTFSSIKTGGATSKVSCAFFFESLARITRFARNPSVENARQRTDIHHDKPAVEHKSDKPTQRSTSRSAPTLSGMDESERRLRWSRKMQTTLTAAIDSYLRMHARSRGTRNEY